MVRLTYQELAARLNLSPQAARMRARRRRWPVTRGNDGLARVSLDEAELAAEAERVHPNVHERSPARSGARSPGRSASEAEQAAELAALRAQVLALTERAVQAEAENGVLRATLAREQARGDRLEARLAMPWWKRWLEG